MSTISVGVFWFWLFFSRKSLTGIMMIIISTNTRKSIEILAYWNTLILLHIKPNLFYWRSLWKKSWTRWKRQSKGKRVNVCFSFINSRWSYVCVHVRCDIFANIIFIFVWLQKRSHSASAILQILFVLFLWINQMKEKTNTAHHIHNTNTEKNIGISYIFRA